MASHAGRRRDTGLSAVLEGGLAAGVILTSGAVVLAVSRTGAALALPVDAGLALAMGVAVVLVAGRRSARAATLLTSMTALGQSVADLQAERDALLFRLDAAEDQAVRGDRAGEDSAETQRQVVEALSAALERLSAGDLSFRMEAIPAPGYAELANHFNAAVGVLGGTLDGISDCADAMGRGVAEITHAAHNLSRRTEQQAASLAQTAASLDELTASVRYSAEGAAQVEATVQRACRDAADSDQLVDEAVAAMGEIRRSSSEIDHIVGLIEEISFQTNLLALNAGVEAARAGEAGRGFAVVATEVRALAQRSAHAAKEIKTLILASGEQVQRGVALVDRTGGSLRHIAVQVSEIACTISEIAASAREQAHSLAEVNTAMNRIDLVTQQNAAMVEETTAATYDLGRRSDELATLVHGFALPAIAPAALDEAA